MILDSLKVISEKPQVNQVVPYTSHSMVRRKIGLKSSVMDMGNWVISSVNAQGNRQVDPMLML